MLTVDCPVYGNRLNESRNNLALPEGINYPNIAPGRVVDLAQDEDFLAHGQQYLSCVLSLGLILRTRCLGYMGVSR